MRESAPVPPDEVNVKLKSLFGISPGTYLPVMYGVGVLVLLFLIFLLPGVLHPGTLFTVRSSPAGAAVSVDGVVRGVAGDAVFVPSGDRTIEVSKPGYEPVQLQLVVRRRLVGSLLFPRRELLDVHLDTVAAVGLIHDALLEFSRWALVGEASGQYQFPPVARTLGADLAGSANGEEYDAFIAGALAHVNSEAQLNDLLSGALLARSGGAAASPLAIATVLGTTASVAERVPALPLQLDRFLTGLRRETVAATKWSESALAAMSAVQRGTAVTAATARGAVVTYGGIPFVAVDGGSGLVGGTDRAERGGDIPYYVQTPPLLVSQTEITVAEFARFVADRPEWSPDNRDALVLAGLADGEYLADWADGVPSATLPVRYVSAFAAEAFATWFSATIADSGLIARLPGEAEWDYFAARDQPGTGVFASRDRSGPAVVGESVRGSLGLYGIEGNVWEWTATSFASYARYYTDEQSSNAPSAHRVVRGGGWATFEADYTSDDRGSMPPDWCSPAVGFRIVLGGSVHG